MVVLCAVARSGKPLPTISIAIAIIRIVFM
jgi:hypothetical protein